VLHDENDFACDARLHGTELESDERTEAVAYLLEDGRLVVLAGDRYGQERLFYHEAAPELDESEWLAQWFSQGEIVGIMAKLGKRAVVDIGEA
jgi:hypothetical protein